MTHAGLGVGVRLGHRVAECRQATTEHLDRSVHGEVQLGPTHKLGDARVRRHDARLGGKQRCKPAGNDHGGPRQRLQQRIDADEGDWLGKL